MSCAYKRLYNRETATLQATFPFLEGVLVGSGRVGDRMDKGRDNPIAK